MFSYFKNGITDTNPQKIIDLPALIKTIKNNPERALIEWIRVLRTNGNDEYKELKRGLPNITPNCMVRYRSLQDDDFERNFQSFNQYIFFDIDTPGDEYKQYFIKKYGHLVSMVSKSSSGGGLSILLKVSNTITKDNFESIWYNIRTTILKDETVDEKCKDIGRAMFISYDPEVYYNYDNEITVEISDTKDVVKEENHPISYGENNNRLVYSFSDKKKEEYSYSVLPIDIVLTKLDRRTKVSVDNPIIDFKPVEYAEVYIPKIIKDGTKHTIYTAMIHQLVYLNPSIEKEYIFSFLFYVNNNHAKPRMNMKELVRLFNFIYDTIKSTGITHHSTITKYVHFNPNYKLTGKEKSILSNTINGYFKRYTNINKIIAAKQELNSTGAKVTSKLVSKLTGLSIKTVQTHFKSEPIDMDQVILNFNHPQNYINQI